MLRSLDLENFMLRKPVKVKADANLMEAVDLILQHRISGLCVVDDSDKLVGVLSEMDCLQAILSSTYNESGVGNVGEYMTSDDLFVSPLNCDVLDVAQDMLKHRLRRMPVVANDKLVGQITCRQLLKAVKNFSR